MSREAFEAIMAGIKDAGEYLRGDSKGRRVHKVKVDRVDVAKVREALELTQQEFAAVFCVNAGTNRPWMEGGMDLDGNPRLDLSCHRVDIGCYEYAFSGTLITIR